MTTPEPIDPPPTRVGDAVAELPYTLDIVASVCGLSSQTVLHYHEQGLVHAVEQDDAGENRFDDESVHRLRRIEHLRSAYGMEMAALKLTLGLMDELDRLRAELRRRG